MTYCHQGVETHRKDTQDAGPMAPQEHQPLSKG